MKNVMKVQQVSKEARPVNSLIKSVDLPDLDVSNLPKRVMGEVSTTLLKERDLRKKSLETQLERINLRSSEGSQAAFLKLYEEAVNSSKKIKTANDLNMMKQKALLNWSEFLKNDFISGDCRETFIWFLSQKMFFHNCF